MNENQKRSMIIHFNDGSKKVLVFQSQFSLEDQKEGMAALLEKRKPAFKHR